MAGKLSSSIRIALVQVKGDNSDPARFAPLLERIRQAAAKGAKVVLLPELVFHPYFCIEENPEHFDLAHGLDHERMAILSSLAAELEIVLSVPYFEKRDAGIYYNSLVVYDADGTVAGHYRKMHIPDDPGFYEKYYFTPGDTGFQCITTRYIKLGALICWDQWFPEAARMTALKGAQLLYYPTAIGWDDKELDGLTEDDAEGLKLRQRGAWTTMQRSHAIANGLYVAAVNRVGGEGHLDFWGHSFVADPEGAVSEFLGREEGLLLSDLHLDRLDATRRVWPFFRDRRIDAYAGLTERYAS